MKKYNIMGFEMAKMEDVKWCIRDVRRSIDEIGAKKSDEAKDYARFVLELVIRSMFIDEIRSAQSEEDKENILEMTGDFMVVVSTGSGKNRNIRYFEKYEDKKPVLTRFAYRAMNFLYESKAEEVAEGIGEDAYVLDTNEQEHQKHLWILNAIFNEPEEDA